MPPEQGGPDPRALAGELHRFLAVQPRPTRAAVNTAAIGLEAVSLAAFGHRLARVDPQRRSKLLARLGATGTVGLGMDALKALVLLTHGADLAADEIAAVAGSRPPARPDAPLDVTVSSEWPSDSRADVVVVGSGASGAMVARTLARDGLDVVVVEEGRRHEVAEFRSGRPLDRFAGLYRDGGATAALGRPPVMLPVGRGVGGTTLVNSGTCYRTPARVLAAWRDGAGLAFADPEQFGPYLDDVWATLQVGPVPAAVMGRNGELALEGARNLGWSARPIDRNAPGCGGSSQCAIGCPRNAKFGVHLNALPQACEAGARLVSEARVQAVLVERGRARGVVASRPDGSTFTVRASIATVVATGATETPLLLRRSGLGRHHRIGRNLYLHPALGVSGRFEEEVFPSRGVLQSAAVDHFHDDRGILIEATSTPPGMGSMVLPGYGGELLAELATAEHRATLGAMIADLPSGRVYGRRRAVVRYDLHRRDGQRLVEAIAAMGRILMAAGATEVITGIAGYERVRDQNQLDEAVAHADPRRLHLAAFHPVGTAAAGSDPERFPVDERGALRGVRGVWVADGSVLPTCPEVNPQVSIMAAALAIADGIGEDERGRP